MSIGWGASSHSQGKESISGRWRVNVFFLLLVSVHSVLIPWLPSVLTAAGLTLPVTGAVMAAILVGTMISVKITLTFVTATRNGTIRRLTLFILLASSMVLYVIAVSVVPHNDISKTCPTPINHFSGWDKNITTPYSPPVSTDTNFTATTPSSDDNNTVHQSNVTIVDTTDDSGSQNNNSVTTDNMTTASTASNVSTIGIENVPNSSNTTASTSTTALTSSDVNETIDENANVSSANATEDGNTNTTSSNVTIGLNSSENTTTPTVLSALLLSNISGLNEDLLRTYSRRSKSLDQSPRVPKTLPDEIQLPSQIESNIKNKFKLSNLYETDGQYFFNNAVSYYSNGKLPQVGIYPKRYANTKANYGYPDYNSREQKPSNQYHKYEFTHNANGRPEKLNIGISSTNNVKKTTNSFTQDNTEVDERSKNKINLNKRIFNEEINLLKYKSPFSYPKPHYQINDSLDRARREVVLKAEKVSALLKSRSATIQIDLKQSNDSPQEEVNDETNEFIEDNSDQSDDNYTGLWVSLLLVSAAILGGGIEASVTRLWHCYSHGYHLFHGRTRPDCDDLLERTLTDTFEFSACGEHFGWTRILAGCYIIAASVLLEVGCQVSLCLVYALVQV